MFGDIETLAVVLFFCQQFPPQTDRLVKQLFILLARCQIDKPIIESWVVFTSLDTRKFALLSGGQEVTE